MNDGYTTKNYLLYGQNQACVASSTKIVSTEIPVTSGASLAFLAYLSFSGVTEAAGITVKVEHSPVAGVWIEIPEQFDVANGQCVIRLLAQDPATVEFTPLFPVVRLSVVTGVGDSCTVTGVHVTRRL